MTLMVICLHLMLHRPLRCINRRDVDSKFMYVDCNRVKLPNPTSLKSSDNIIQIYRCALD